jgi:membrane protein YdbS with pleckstrin-like domain
VPRATLADIRKPAVERLQRKQPHRCRCKEERKMSRIWLIPVAVAAIAGAASLAQAAPASSMLGTAKVAATEQVGTATQVNYRWYRYRYYRHHHRHHRWW